MSEVYQCKYSFMVYYEINKVSIIIVISLYYKIRITTYVCLYNITGQITAIMY